ncbi:extracellular solute-binding protein [Shimia sagamensis]|uniref:Putrescine transport system substrate-binding protein n=1 Tax=Shimia sagamensis TaxID=1566352 RepID=A0ABY1N5H9_9RHOB|nr:extracellular solute-binding protein [Shimia sagamensis]SMP00685.1 putrescine transport system substrate-binding protein [Shimia sagamensis]
MRMTSMLVSVSCCFGIGAVPVLAHDSKVLVYNWSDYVAEEVLENWEEDTGFGIEIDSYANANEAEARLVARGTGYDIVVVSSESVGRIIASGGVQRLIPENFPDVVMPLPFLESLLFSNLPEARDYAVPYMWGTTGVAYNIEEVAARIPDAPTDGWSLIFDPENAKRMADCGITIVDSNEEVVAAALAYLGKNPRSKDTADVDAAFEVLRAIEPYISDFNTEQYDDLMNGEICLSLTWSSEGLGPMLEGEGDYKYVIPKEGTNIWADVIMVPIDAKHLELAHKTINHLMNKQNLALGVEYLFGAISSNELVDVVDRSLFDSPAMSLPEDVRETLYLAPHYSGSEKETLDKRWRQLQLGM